ncbi:MAG: PilW family protein [Candidatus Saccharicenans sp.]
MENRKLNFGKEKIISSLNSWFKNKAGHKLPGRAGFTLIEVLIASAIMVVVVVGALALYSRSNQISVDQLQYAELQHDVRSALYLMTRDIRMTGVGMPEGFEMFYLEGKNNEDQGTEVKPDRLRILGNIDFPLLLRIEKYQGSAATVFIEQGGFASYPYPEEFYQKRIVMIFPNPASPCRRAVTRYISNVEFSSDMMNFPPGQAPDINPPGGLTAGTECNSDDYDGGYIMLPNVKEFWLDLTGRYPGLTPGVNGYAGEPGILYLTNNNSLHIPLAQNIEDLQFEYNGDFNDDGLLDGFRPWSDAFTDDEITRIRQIRIIVVGRTPSRMASVSGKVPANIYNYRKPPVSDSPASATDDYHRRFVLETTVNIRNLNLNLYNTGQR